MKKNKILNVIFLMSLLNFSSLFANAEVTSSDSNEDYLEYDDLGIHGKRELNRPSQIIRKQKTKKHSGNDLVYGTAQCPRTQQMVPGSLRCRVDNPSGTKQRIDQFTNMYGIETGLCVFENTKPGDILIMEVGCLSPQDAKQQESYQGL